MKGLGNNSENTQVSLLKPGICPDTQNCIFSKKLQLSNYNNADSYFHSIFRLP